MAHQGASGMAAVTARMMTSTSAPTEEVSGTARATDADYSNNQNSTAIVTHNKSISQRSSACTTPPPSPPVLESAQSPTPGKTIPNTITSDAKSTTTAVTATITTTTPTEEILKEPSATLSDPSSASQPESPSAISNVLSNTVRHPSPSPSNHIASLSSTLLLQPPEPPLLAPRLSTAVLSRPTIQPDSPTSSTIAAPTAEPPAGLPQTRRRRKPLNPVRLDATVPAVHFKFPIIFPPTPPLPAPTAASSSVSNKVKEEEQDVKTPTSPRPMTPMSSPAVGTTDDDDAVAGAAGSRLGKRYHGRSDADVMRKKLKVQEEQVIQRMEVLHYPLLLPHMINQQQAGMSMAPGTSPSYSTHSYGNPSSSTRRRPVGASSSDDRMLLADGHRTGSDVGLRGKRKNVKDSVKRRGRSLTPDRTKVRVLSKSSNIGSSSHMHKTATLTSRSLAPVPSHGQASAPIHNLSASYPGPSINHTAAATTAPSSSNQKENKQNDTIVRFGQVLQRVCRCCGATKSPQGTWRTGWIDTVVLCNGCGLRYKNTRVYCKKCSYIPTKGELASGRATNCKKCGEPLTRVVPS